MQGEEGGFRHLYASDGAEEWGLVLACTLLQNWESGFGETGLETKAH